MGRPRKATIIPLVLTDPHTGDDYSIQPLDEETPPAYRAFLDYCSMERPGVPHLLRRYQRDQDIIDAHRASVAAEEKKLSMGDGAMVTAPAWIPKAPPSTNPSTVWGWYHRHKWATRSDLYRDLFSRVRRAGMVEALVGGIHQLAMAFEDVMSATAIEARKLTLASSASREPAAELKDLALVAQRFTMILARVASPTNGDLDMSKYTPTRSGAQNSAQEDLLDNAWTILEENLTLSVSDTRADDGEKKPGDPYELES